MFDDLENMLGGNVATGQKTKTQATKAGGRLSKRGSNSQIVPMNDLDDLDDMDFGGNARRDNAIKATKVTA